MPSIDEQQTTEKEFKYFLSLAGPKMNVQKAKLSPATKLYIAACLLLISERMFLWSLFRKSQI